MKYTNRHSISNYSNQEETFWDCCLALIPTLYICIMTLGVCLLFRYGLNMQDDPALGAEIHTPGRISKYYIVVAALYYVFLGLALLFPIRRGWEGASGASEAHNTDDWRFSVKKALCLGISIIGAILIHKTRFYVLWDEQIANQCRTVLLVGGAILAILGHIIIRVAIRRKAEPEQNLSYTASSVCESITKICYVLMIIGAVISVLLIPTDKVIF